MTDKAASDKTDKSGSKVAGQDHPNRTLPLQSTSAFKTRSATSRKQSPRGRSLTRTTEFLDASVEEFDFTASATFGHSMTDDGTIGEGFGRDSKGDWQHVENSARTSSVFRRSAGSSRSVSGSRLKSGFFSKYAERCESPVSTGSSRSASPIYDAWLETSKGCPSEPLDGSGERGVVAACVSKIGNYSTLIDEIEFQSTLSSNKRKSKQERSGTRTPDEDGNASSQENLGHSKTAEKLGKHLEGSFAPGSIRQQVVAKKIPFTNGRIPCRRPETRQGFPIKSSSAPNPSRSPSRKRDSPKSGLMDGSRSKSPAM